ncbi:MAG: hypothetical protein ACXVY8_05150 [Gaiellaceae bacterium]
MHIAYFAIQELYQQQVAEWERDAEVRRMLRRGKEGRGRSGAARSGIDRRRRSILHPLLQER